MSLEKIPGEINKEPDKAEKLLKEVQIWEREHKEKENKKEETKEKKTSEGKEKIEQKAGPSEKPKEKENPASLKIVNHFQEELKKLEDFPDQKEYQKYNKCNEALKLIEDWLPFGYLDDFQGITKVLSVMEKSKPKTAITFGSIQEKTARKVAYEMAFQYSKWKKDNALKTKTIQNFIDKWLKEKSYYYQAGENWKDFWSTLPEKYLQSRAKNGYSFEGNVTGKATKEDRFEPDKLQKSFEFSMRNLIKLAGGRDKTLSGICKILAAQGVAYSDFSPLMQGIENQFIKQRTDSQLLDLEEQEDSKKLAFILKEKKRVGTLPLKPLKIKYFERLLEEEIANKKIPPKQAELFLNVLANNKELLKNKEAREVLSKFQEKIKGFGQKQSAKEQSELLPKEQKTIAKVKEFIKKKGPKKESIWRQTGAIAEYSFFLFIVLFFIGEMELIKKATGINIKGKK